MLRPRLKTILYAFSILLGVLIICGVGTLTYAFFSLNSELKSKLESKKFLVPTEYYAAPFQASAPQTFSPSQLKRLFKNQNYRERQYDLRILPGDFFSASGSECASRMQLPITENETQCFAWVNARTPSSQADQELQILLIDSENRITRTFQGAPFAQTTHAQGEARLIAQYLGIEPVMQRSVSLGEIPPVCSNAIMAIEDVQFLEHGGVSLRGTFRALFKNISAGRTAQGGSTITQQLVKNYFLTSERTLKRKFQEFIMSILLESSFTKDQILETYLNIIYMGQNGSFQVRGYGAAANYYFSKEASELNISECALLAAIVNSPGRFNPFRNAVPAERRRNLVLEKMREFHFVSDSDFEIADKEPLPSAPRTIASETAPYYLDAVRKQLSAQGIESEGLKIFTALNLENQEAAQESLQDHLENLEKNNKHIRGLKEKGSNLEGSVLLVDNYTGHISAAVGGRSFRMTQFNRAVDGHRQIGSIMKPFVYLTALMNESPDGVPYNPVTILNDERFTFKYEGQNWSPVNYGRKYFGSVPMFYALKNSLNAATASLGLAVGLGNVADVTHLMGVKSELKALPAMTLGAFEMYPQEVLESYMTFANMGMRRSSSFVISAEDSNGKKVYEFNAKPVPTVPTESVAALVGMMKQTVISGTARAIPLYGFHHPAAGKTGTTNDNKDAWFAGFTPYLTAVVWVGYDNNLSHKLTGSSGAVPIWVQLMKKTATRYPPDDFAWPSSTEKVLLDSSTLSGLNAVQENDPIEVELIFDSQKKPSSF